MAFFSCPCFRPMGHWGSTMWSSYVEALEFSSDASQDPQPARIGPASSAVSWISTGPTDGVWVRTEQDVHLPLGSFVLSWINHPPSSSSLAISFFRQRGSGSFCGALCFSFVDVMVAVLHPRIARQAFHRTPGPSCTRLSLLDSFFPYTTYPVPLSFRPGFCHTNLGRGT